jgi:hypothetical protein
MHYFEFGVTATKSYKKLQTIYICAPSSGKAIAFVDSRKDLFYDFIYRTSVPACCLPYGAKILYTQKSQTES